MYTSGNSLRSKDRSLHTLELIIDYRVYTRFTEGLFPLKKIRISLLKHLQKKPNFINKRKYSSFWTELEWIHNFNIIIVTQMIIIQIL